MRLRAFLGLGAVSVAFRGRPRPALLGFAGFSSSSCSSWASWSPPGADTLGLEAADDDGDAEGLAGSGRRASGRSSRVDTAAGCAAIASESFVD